MKSIRVLLADESSQSRESIRILLSFDKDIEIIGEARDGLEAIQKVKGLGPDILIMDANLPKLDGITATEKLYLENPECAVIVTSSDGNQEHVRKAFKAGARDFIAKPFNPEELSESIKRIYQLESKRLLIPKDKRELSKPHVITVFGTKGGVGKTTLAVNLAVLLASTKKKVALVDIDLQFGDVSIFLNLVPKRTISELVQEGDQLDIQIMESYLIPHLSGIKVLCAPGRPEYSELVTTSHIASIITHLKINYDYVVVDTPPLFNETNITALELSSQILVVLTLDLATLKNIKLALELLESLHQRGKAKLILNRVMDESEIKLIDAEQTLDFLIASEIPNDVKLALASVNKGIPVVLSNPQARITQAMRKMSEMVIKDKGYQQDIAESQRKKGLFGRMILSSRR